MKFGENLHLRSVAQWSYYNVDYNGLKDLIKTRTFDPPSEPVFIPGQGGPPRNNWHSLEDELFPILREQYEKPQSFIKSKYGEIERRLTDLVKRVDTLKKGAIGSPGRPRVMQSRKYQRLVQDADALSDDIQSLARFANTQRQAFRKILKKYEKWTHSPGLRIRVQKELLQPSSDSLHPDLDPLLQKLAETSIALKQVSKNSASEKPTGLSNQKERKTPSAALLHEAFQAKPVLEAAAAFASTPLGKHSGRAVYWVHPDNLEEARVLLLRHMKQAHHSKEGLSRVASDLSGISRGNGSISDRPLAGPGERQHVVLLDNVERFAREQNATTIESSETMEGHVPIRVALSGWWSDAPDAYVLMLDLAPAASSSKPECLVVRRKDLSSTLSRDASLSKPKKSSQTPATITVQEYLNKHRDVKPLAQMQSNKSFYSGTSNSTEVGTWASLETNIIISPFSPSFVEDTSEDTGENFPHAVLEIRWEFSNTPEVVRAFDNSHVVERVRGFSLEAHTIFTICKPDMTAPLWLPLLAKDIRKIPLPSNRYGKRRAGAARVSSSLAITTSGPSSTEGPSDSVFTAGPSSATSITTPNISSPDLSQTKKPDVADPPPRKKKTSHVRPVKQPVVERYWNEFDDGSDFEESYAIYVNPDEPVSFPGAETVSKAFSAMYDSMSKGKKRVFSLFSLKPRDSDDVKTPGERQPLLRGLSSSDQDAADSSDSDVEMGKKAKNRIGQNSSAFRRSLSISTQSDGRPLGARRQARENGLFQGYMGLLAVSYILLIMSMILKTTGRKKAMLQVDAGVVGGVLAAEACGFVAMGLLCMRKRRTITVAHQVAVGLAFAIVAVAGTVLLVTVAVGRVG